MNRNIVYQQREKFYSKRIANIFLNSRYKNSCLLEAVHHGEYFSSIACKVIYFDWCISTTNNTADHHLSEPNLWMNKIKWSIGNLTNNLWLEVLKK